MADSLSAQADKAAIEAVKKDAPASFTVGGTFDGHKAEGGLTYNRTWRNGWGLTAYAKAYWNDAPVVPRDRFGGVVGFEGKVPLGPK